MATQNVSAYTESDARQKWRVEETLKFENGINGLSFVDFVM